MRAFIVRPFGVKNGIDFDAVERVLLQPALRAARMPGATTAEIAQAGNIREDMFRMLVTADLVIADLSIHNANVFYELGVRHGLRPRGTLLIRADVDKYPFDLQTDRFLLYDRARPEASVAALAEAIEQTRDSATVDSPVFKMLPRLPAPSPSVLRVVPQDFREMVDYAQQSGNTGDLRLLAHETEGFEWASEGLRTVGRAQFAAGAWRGACETFESLRTLIPGDIEASQRLGTCYQKLGDLPRSTQAIQRVIDAPSATPFDRAEAFALQGRNAKARWSGALEGVSDAERPATALRRPELQEAIDKYAEGFEQDLNHFYPGLNALSLLRVRNELAQLLPAVWAEGFEEEDAPQRELAGGLSKFQQLAGAVQMSVTARETYLSRQQPQDAEQLMWAGISRADLAFLTGSKPKAVARKYAEALAGASSFGRNAARTQLEIYQALGLRKEFVDAALAAIEAVGEAPAAAVPGRQKSPILASPERVLLFTGHMIDRPNRAGSRFPPTAAAESAARRMIRASVEAERALEHGRILGVAGGACGGDILFHEVCADLGIETRLFLALPQGPFCASSVQHGGKEWVERFNQLCARLPPRVLGDSEDLPVWLRRKPEYSVWQRNNLWMLFNALALEARSLTLIALWDRGPADGPGGTQDLVAQVTSRGHKVDRLPAETLRECATD